MLSIMNEIDPCLLLPLCVLYEIKNQIYQHYQLLTERWLYQGLHQSKYTHCQAPGCGPIMACEVIRL